MLVYHSGMSSINIPPELGTPKPGQLNGTVGEQLIELCGRTCYDSLGQGRSSDAYHKHIKEVGHGSVWEHYNITIRLLVLKPLPWLLALKNRPGVWVEYKKNQVMEITFNPRVVIHPPFTDGHLETLSHALSVKCPQIWSHNSGYHPYEFVPPSELNDQQMWFSFFLKGSRGWSHEQVRHKWRVAVSQRSTRYVDETDSPWDIHPILRDYIAEYPAMGVWLRSHISEASHVYAQLVDTLQPWLVLHGADSFTARKQARGAARGFLGNALQTQMIFSASLWEWREIIRQRCSPAADAEIREIIDEVGRALGQAGY